MENVVAMVLAGGAFSSLRVIAKRRAKAAIPFGGIYRIIDFVLSNLMKSDIELVGILAQYRPASLIDHVGMGASWDMYGRTRSVKILPPYQGGDVSDWYKGTADAVYQNLNFIQDHHPSEVMILAGENVYSMDYQEVLRFHREKQADCTLVCKKLPAPNAQRFGILTLDDDQRVTTYQEKPQTVSGDYFSAGIYVFKTSFLIEKLVADASRPTSKHNFADDLIPEMLAKGDRFYAYPFDGYWAYCGTVEEYWQTNMDLLKDPSPVNVWDWSVRTNLDDRNIGGHAPAIFTDSAKVVQSLVSPGCTIHGTVEQSILSPGVVVEEGAVVRHSIIFHECVIKRGTILDHVISDKDVVIGAGCQIGIGDETVPNEKFPEDFYGGLTVLGKDAIVGDHVYMGRNVLVSPGVAIPANTVIASGRVVE